MTTGTETTLRFERETCGRCGGSGRYSYNQMHGSRCYGCNGKGERLTKRGAAAAKFFSDMCMKRAGDVVPGDIIEYNGATNAGQMYKSKLQISSVEPSTLNPGCIDLVGTDGNMKHIITTGTNSLQKLVFNGEEKRRRLAEAIEYQNNLTKAGKPRKR